MLKATSVNAAGGESHPASLEVNESGYVLLPEDPDAVSYNVYAPLKGFEATGPWYFKRSYRRREAKGARFTVVGLYSSSDLIPVFCPEDSMLVTLPDSTPGQEFWLMGGYVNGKVIPHSIVKCGGGNYVN